MSDPLEQLMDSLAELRRFWERPERKRRFVDELGEPVEFGVLRALFAVHRHREQGDDDAGPGVGDVAAVLGIDTSTASRLLEQAVTMGYVARTSAPDDRRRSRLAVTAEGQAVLERAYTIRRRWLGEITAGWRPEDVERLAALLQRFVTDATAEEPSA